MTRAAFSRPIALSLLAATALGATTIAIDANAQQPPSSPRAELVGLAVHRTDDSLECPDAPRLAAMVEAQMRRPALDPALRPAALDVQIYRSEAGFTAVLVAGDKTRHLSNKGAACAGLAEALAVTLAILLDSGIPLAQPPAPAPSSPLPTPPPQPPPPVATLPPQGPPPPSAPVDQAPAYQPLDEVPAPPRPWSLSLGFGAIETVGIALPFTGGYAADFEVRASRDLAFDVGAMYLVPRSLAFQQGQVEVSLATSYLRVCGTLLGSPARLAMGACVEPLVGVITGAGTGYQPDASVTRAWIAAGALAWAGGRVTGPFGWVAHVGVYVPFTREGFFVGDQSNVAFSPAPVGASADASLRFTLF